MIGTTISHYHIFSKLGQGGMGEVYLAEDTKLDRKVALKLLPDEVSLDHERMRRFVQEAKSASALNHPNIITIYEIGETESRHFIATEFIDGETLRKRMRHGHLKLIELIEIAIQTAVAHSGVAVIVLPGDVALRQAEGGAPRVHVSYTNVPRSALPPPMWRPLHGY